MSKGGLFSDANVTVQILDANDNAPRFSSNTIQITVNESQAVDVPFFTVGATDMDMGTNADVVYSMEKASSFFTVDQTTGEKS